jgi:quercetin dioxygenase-like cupin family protein
MTTLHVAKTIQRSPLRCVLLLVALALVGAAAFMVAPARATLPVGVTSTTLAGPIRLDEIDVAVRSALPTEPGENWKGRIETNEESDLYVIQNDFSPGGNTGWHTHPGPSLVSVTMGTITVYEASDLNCAPHVYHAGEGFVDRGGKHVHLLRNETNMPAQTIATQLIPAGAVRRTEANQPSNCPPI